VEEAVKNKNSKFQNFKLVGEPPRWLWASNRRGVYIMMLVLGVQLMSCSL